MKEVGVSNFRPHGTLVLLQSAMKSKLVTNQIEISLAATQGFTNGDIAFHQERSTNLMAWSPLGGGSLMTDEGILGKALSKDSCQCMMLIYLQLLRCMDIGSSSKDLSHHGYK